MVAPEELNSAKTTDGFTGLHIAVLNGKTELVKFLLKEVCNRKFSYPISIVTLRNRKFSYPISKQTTRLAGQRITLTDLCN